MLYKVMVSFNEHRAGDWMESNETSGWTKALVGAGYLVPEMAAEVDDDSSDHVEPAVVPDADLDPAAPKSEVTRGEGEPDSSGEDPDS